MAGGTDGNINADPLFVDGPAPSPFSFVGGNYNLQPGSPALDAGNTDLDTSQVDFANNPRVFGAAIDMGAYESQQAPLPVKLISFSGLLQNSTANLQWQTGVEENFSRFELQKSSNGSTFITAATILPKGSNSHYHYALPQVNARAYYRLKILDNNGKEEYSDVLPLTQGVNDKLYAYPNPASDFINVQAPVAGILYIFDAGGRIIKQQHCSQGTNRVRITSLSAGVYSLQIAGEKIRFVKNR